MGPEERVWSDGAKSGSDMSASGSLVAGDSLVSTAVQLPGNLEAAGDTPALSKAKADLGEPDLGEPAEEADEERPDAVADAEADEERGDVVADAGASPQPTEPQPPVPRTIGEAGSDVAGSIPPGSAPAANPAVETAPGHPHAAPAAQWPIELSAAVHGGLAKGALMLTESERRLVVQALPEGISLVLFLEEEEEEEYFAPEQRQQRRVTRGLGRGGRGKQQAVVEPPPAPKRSLREHQVPARLVQQEEKPQHAAKRPRGRRPKPPESEEFESASSEELATQRSTVSARSTKSGRGQKRGAEKDRPPQDRPTQDRPTQDRPTQDRPTQGRRGQHNGRQKGNVDSPPVAKNKKKDVASDRKRGPKKRKGAAARSESPENVSSVVSGEVVPVDDRPKEAAAGQAGNVCKLLSAAEKTELQVKIDKLNDDQLDRVLDFLAPDLGDASDGQDVQLDLDSLRPNRQHALVKFVDAELAAATAGLATAPQAAPPQPTVMSPAFPAMEPGNTPLVAGTPLAAEGTPPPGGHAASAAKRQLAWEACSAREVQRQSHLREVREAASVAGSTPALTPAGGEPTANEPVPAIPELTLPPAAVPHGSANGTAAAPAAAVPSLVEDADGGAPAAGSDAAALSVAVSGDSMLESTAEVLNAVDFSWK